MMAQFDVCLSMFGFAAALVGFFQQPIEHLRQRLVLEVRQRNGWNVLPK